MKINEITNSEFKKYGKILDNYDCSEIINEMNKLDVPKDVVYEPSIKELEKLDICRQLKERKFGGMPIQIGYCNGNNNKLNAVEYHTSSEINIAVTDMILLLGKEQDIDKNFCYDTSKIEAFLIPAGTIIEVYATTLHYAPCNAVDDGFKCVVVLPKGTNYPLENQIEKTGEDKLLFAKNKWLIAHEETNLGDEGAFVGLVGKNITLK